MSAPEPEAMPSQEDIKRLNEPLDMGHLQNIMDIYESEHFSDSYDTEDGEDDDDDDEEDGDDEEEGEEEKNMEALYNNLSTYESQLDQERFTELEKMLTECDDIIKESDRHLGTLDSFKKTVSLTFSDSEEDTVEDLELLQICGSETPKGDNSPRETTDDVEKDQLFLTEGPAEENTDDKMIHDGEVVAAVSNKISDLTRELQLQLTEADETYERLLGEQSERHKEMNENAEKLDSERRDNLALLEEEKVQRQHEKEERETAMFHWEEDHQIQVKEELEIQEIYMKRLDDLMGIEKEAGDYLTRVKQDNKNRRERRSATIIQSIFRMYRTMKEYRILQKKRKEEEEKRKEEEIRAKQEEERRKVEEEKEKEKRRLKENEERIKREKEEEIRKEEEERRKREEEESRKKMEEERKKREEEERVKIEEEMRKKKEEEERKKREEEQRARIEEERRKKKEEEEREKKEREERERKEEERLKIEEEEKQRREKEEREKREKEEERQKKEEEERMRIEMEEKKKKEEEEMKKVEEERKKERMKREEEERMKREEEEKKKKADEERRIKEEEETEERKERERHEGERQRIDEEKEEKETKEEKQKTMREAEEKKRSEVVNSQIREKEEDMKMRKKEEDTERNQGPKMEDLSIEIKHVDDKVVSRNIQKEAICDKKSVDPKQLIKGGGIMNEESEGVWGIEKEERVETRANEKERGSEKVGERGEELKTNLEKLMCRKMDVEDGEKEEKMYPQDMKKVPTHPAQQEMNAVTETGQIEASYLQPLPQIQNDRRLAWMENCVPWGKISNQPWIGDRKDKTSTKSGRKRPPSNKRLPKPLSEEVILSVTKSASLTQVTSVHLENQSGFTLATLGQCPSLQYLAVNNCQLLTLDGLQTCSQVRYIDVKNNNVEYVNVKGMNSLQVLDLSHNNLGLIHGLEGCSNLLWLNLQHNRITKFGSGLESLRRLHTLLLGHNQLISTSGLQDGGLELQTLDLSHNQLHDVTDIEKFCLLRTLDVSSNNLMETPNFTNHVLMQELNLSDNCLSSLTELSQCWLPLLRVLNLGQNRLPSVPPMEYIHSLKMIDITNNQLLDFAGLTKALSNCKQLEQLLIHGNPLSNELNHREQMVQTFPNLHYLDSVSSNACALEKNRSTTSSSEIQSDNGFQCMCANQTELFEKLENKFHQRLKSIFELEPLDLLGACSAHVKWCQKSLRMAVEFRYAHEYGDTSTGKLLSVYDSIEQIQGSAPTLNSTDAPEIVAKVTSPATYHDPSCHTAGKSQDTCPKGQVSETHLDRSGHDHPVVVASGSATPQEHATTEKAGSTKHLQTHEYSRLASKMDVTSEDHSKSKEQHECAKRPKVQDSNQNGDLLAKRNKAATHIQAAWRGFNLRAKLHSALEFAQNVYEEESEFGEEIDLESFDMAEADLEKTWTVSESPSIPMNFPVLGKPPLFRNSSHLNLRLSKSRDGNRSILDDNISPAPPREAWKTPVGTARSHLPLNGALRPRSSQVLRISPPATPTSGTKESDLMTVISRRKDDEICKEWGFKDVRTAQMMLQRAKKMKFNAERREKLKKLDPHQRLALFRKLGEVAPLIPMKSPPMKMLPKKEYFQSRQLDMELNMRDTELNMRDIGAISKEEETKIKENRTYQWIHTQIAPSDNSDTRSQQSILEKNSSRGSNKLSINTSQRLFLFQKSQVTGAGVISTGNSEQSRSATDSENGSSRNSRRHSTPSSQKRPVHLPPIDRSPAPPTHQGKWMSHWKPDVNKSDGWGGGKKRNKRR